MNKTVLITGASRGIGKSTALEFARLGYNVVINYNQSHKEAVALENLLGKNAIALQADVSIEKSVQGMVAQALERFNTIDVLVNNAAISQQKLFGDITTTDFQRMFDVNVKGVFNVTKAVLPQMISRKNGKIINVSSIYGMCGASCEVHYSASKGAVIAFTKALAQELGLSNINVNCVAPGVIKTDMLNDFTKEDLDELKNLTPLQKMGTPEDIAKVIAFLASEDASFITGQVISPNGGLYI